MSRATENKNAGAFSAKPRSPSTRSRDVDYQQLAGFNHNGTKARKIEPRSSDYLDEIRQFLPGIEVYPFAGRISIGQTPVSFALNPYQFLENWNQPVGLVVFSV
ncbi:MAG: hypothetical protein ABSH15_16750 [Verrucomicrobiota bacterium]